MRKLIAFLVLNMAAFAANASFIACYEFGFVDTNKAKYGNSELLVSATGLDFTSRIMPTVVTNKHIIDTKNYGVVFALNLSQYSWQERYDNLMALVNYGKYRSLEFIKNIKVYNQVAFVYGPDGQLLKNSKQLAKSLNEIKKNAPAVYKKAFMKQVYSYAAADIIFNMDISGFFKVDDYHQQCDFLTGIPKTSLTKKQILALYGELSSKAQRKKAQMDNAWENFPNFTYIANDTRDLVTKALYHNDDKVVFNMLVLKPLED